MKTCMLPKDVCQYKPIGRYRKTCEALVTWTQFLWDRNRRFDNSLMEEEKEKEENITKISEWFLYGLVCASARPAYVLPDNNANK